MINYVNGPEENSRFGLEDYEKNIDVIDLVQKNGDIIENHITSDLQIQNSFMSPILSFISVFSLGSSLQNRQKVYYNFCNDDFKENTDINDTIGDINELHITPNGHDHEKILWKIFQRNTMMIPKKSMTLIITLLT